jgi:glycosyltransferase involved in cell wall biosynthesis
MGYSSLYNPLGVDVERFSPNKGLRKEYRERVVISYIGHLNYTKGVSLLVDAIEPLLKRWDMRFLLAVTYGPEERVLERIRGHPKVSILGMLTHAGSTTHQTSLCFQEGSWQALSSTQMLCWRQCPVQHLFSQAGSLEWRI